MIHFIAWLILTITNGIHWVLAFVLDEDFLKTWEPIHLCWWFEKNDLEIPPYFIGTHVNPSASPSASPSQSPSASISPSQSPSASTSPSASVSPSASPGWENYSRGDEASLPTGTTDLQTSYSAGEVTNVQTSNDTRVSQTATGEYAIHMFKEYYVGSNAAVTCEVQSDLAPSSSTIILQVYNYNTPGWETLDSDNTSSANTDITLEGTINDTTNYLQNNVMACRVYQLSQ